MKRLPILLLVFVILISCSRWKVSDLQTKKITKLNFYKNDGYIDLYFKNSKALILTFKIFISNGKIYAADNRQNILLIYNLEGKLLRVIGSKDYLENNEKFQNIDKSYFNFSTIGEVVSDNSGNIFVQNRINPKNNSSIEISPSYIIVFDNEGKLQYTLGQKGEPDIPFYYIDKMYTDDSNRLIVISMNFQTWSVYRFKGKEREVKADFAKEKFQQKDKYSPRIENIRIFSNGDSLLVSAAYYDKTRFKYRNIIKYDFNNDSDYKIILNLPDPKNELFALLENQYIMLWDVEEKDLKFVIWNFNESIINNKRIKINSITTFFQDVVFTESGNLYTVTVNKDSIDIEEWE